MKTLIDKIIAHKEQEVENNRKKTPVEDLKEIAAGYKPKSFKNALSVFGIIAEIKAKSPSMGNMNRESVHKAISLYDKFPIVRAISVLTDEHYFGGSLKKLHEYRQKTDKPLLRKDFILDEYQVWEAKAYGADAILLMASVHRKDASKFKAIYELATEIGLDVLIEFGMEVNPQKKFIPKGATIFGINSRKFKTTGTYQLSNFINKFVHKDLTIDNQIHFELFNELNKLVPGKKTIVAESGISQPSELDILIKHGFSAALIGTALLRKGGNIETILESYSSFIKENEPKLAKKLQLHFA